MTAIEIKGIRINLPADITSSAIIGASGHTYLVHVDSDGTRWVDMLVNDCESILLNSEPSCAPWRDANPGAFQRFGGEVRKPEVGIHVASALAARSAAAPRHPLDIGGQVRDTLRAMGRWPR